ncbi:PREDICTED: F-box protein FBW2-like [Prunus mume]|uniref:F-box protein FBW2-like n=1 Tax=Prunus mume TaxID=102107 RepID=A0ABM0P140_PRUMU|nr:PREDICTED: F-box protein FBW2-like [Prunus mume]
MDERRWEDLQMDCLVKVLVEVGMESLLLDVPFVCKSWYKATLNPSCWQSLISPDNKCIEVWPWDVSECPNFQNLMDRFASEYQIDGDRCSVTAFLKFVINRSSGNATVLKLPKCCTVEAFEFAANVCPGLVTLSLPGNVLDNKHTNLELIGKWKNLEVLSLGSCLNLAKILAIIQTHCKNFYGLDLSKGFVDEREALSIVKLVPNIKYLNLKGAKVSRDSLVTLLCGCKDLVMFDARDCSGFDENDDELSKLASHISKFMCEGSEFPEFLRGMDNFVLPVDGFSFQQNVEENWDEMLNDLSNAFNDLSNEE